MSRKANWSASMELVSMDHREKIGDLMNLMSNYVALIALLVKQESRIFVMGAAPNSIQLNLCE